ncbi:MAG: hypothetical protein WA902_14600 [Thermosynechococcaceae cyanobacterium]
MSKLQQSTKPHLVPLIRGDWTRVSSESIKLISAWSAMFSIVYEYADPKTAMIPQDHRRFIKDTMTIPDNWYVWVGKYSPNSKDNGQTNHFGMQAANFNINSPQNIQTTGFAIGKLYVQTFMATPVDEISSFMATSFGRNFNVAKLWPSTRNHIIEPSNIFTPLEVQKASCAIAIAYGSPAFIKTNSSIPNGCTYDSNVLKWFSDSQKQIG